MSANDTISGYTLDQVRAAKRQAVGTFRRLAHVARVGITRVGKGYGLKINLQKAPAGKSPLPATIKGVPVLIEVVGRLRKRLVA